MSSDFASDVKIREKPVRGLYLDEGPCHHCGMAVQFRPTDPATIKISDTVNDDEDSTETVEEFFVGICTRRQCGRTTIARRVQVHSYSRGNYHGTDLVAEGVVYPSPRSTRKPLDDDVPAPLRKTFEEASAIEFISATACGFLAGRLVEQALRDRLLKDGKWSKRELRRSSMERLITLFVEAGHATGDIHEVIELLQGFRNFAAHPPQLEDVEDLDISGSQATFLLNAARELLDHVYVRPARFAAMRSELQQKRRGDAMAHGPEIQIGTEPRVKDPPSSLLSDDDVPF